MPESVYKNQEYQDLIDFARDNYRNSIPENLTQQDEEKYLWEQVQSLDSTLPKYEDIIQEKSFYPSTPDSIDLSVDTVNTIFDTIDEISNQQSKYINTLLKTPNAFDNIGNTTYGDEYKAKYFDENENKWLANRPVTMNDLLTGNPSGYENINIKDKTYEISEKPKIKDLSKMDPYSMISDKNTGSFMQLLVDPDSWLVLNNEHKGLKDAIKRGLNQTVTGLNYNVNKSEDIYDIDMDKYNPNVIETVVQHLTSMSDPTGLLALFGGYGLAGRTGTYTWRGLKSMPPKFMSWYRKASGNYKVGSIAKTKNGLSWRKKILDYIEGEGSDRLAFGTTGFGGAGAIFAAIQSKADQTMNRGKYKGGNGTINPWDTINDSWQGFQESATTGLLITGVGQASQIANIWGSASWKMGHKNYKTFAAKILGSKTSQLGIQGAIFTTMPIALNEEVRKSYYDEEGNFRWKQYAMNNFLSYPVIGAMWGINKMFIPKTQYKYSTYENPNWHRNKGAKILGLPAPKNIN